MTVKSLFDIFLQEIRCFVMVEVCRWKPLDSKL